jgi:glycosyltransferase involved in cell wall biosynthesis
MPGASKLSVVICTHDRARALKRALESLVAAEPPQEFEWEVLVVLSACSDDSTAVVESFRERLPTRAISEPEPGASRARNRAVDVMAGDFTIWLDDDVRVASDLLRRYESAILKWPSASIFGGAIFARAEPPAAPWFDAALPSIDTVYAHLPLDGVDDGAPIAPPRLPYGANFAIRADVQRRYRYDLNLGRTSAKYIRNYEETDVIFRALAGGHEGRWLPSARIDHLMPPERQTLGYIRSYYLGNGLIGGLKARKAGKGLKVAEFVADSFAVARSELSFRRALRVSGPLRWSRRLRAAATTRGIWLGKYGPRPFAMPERIDFET